MAIREVPDPAALGFQAPKWQAALAEYQRLNRQRQEALAEQAGLRQRLIPAQAADNAAHAAALRAGKADPGTPKADKVRDEQAATARRVDALTLAVEQVERDVAAAVEAERDGLLEQVDKAVEERRQQAAAAVDAWHEARIQYAEARALADYLRTYPNGRFKLSSGYMRNYRRRNPTDAVPTVEQVLEMLRRDAEPPADPEKPAYAQPLLPRDTGYGASPYPNMEPVSRR